MRPHSRLMRRIEEEAKARGTMALSLERLGYGVPDALIVRGATFLEAKCPGDRVRPAQREMHKRLRAAGGRVVVVTPENFNQIMMEDWR